MPNSEASIHQRVLENQSTATLYFDVHLTLRYANQAAEILLLTSARALLGKRAEIVLHCPDSNVLDVVERVHAHGAAITERDIRLILPHGEDARVDCTITPISVGEQTDMLIELTPVDRQQQIAHSGEMQAQQDAGRALLRGLAHEIRNPLGGLRGAAQLLAEELGDSELTDYTQVIVDEADRLSVLLKKMVGPTQPPAQLAVNIHEVMERVRALLRNECSDGVHVTFSYDPSLPDLLGDRDQLIQAMLNISVNAVKALDGNGTVELRTRCERGFTIGGRQHRLCVVAEVADDGPGISDELSERVFLPMVTGRADGTGLGLPIAQQLVRAHGGIIEFTSEPGNTVFRVVIPVQEKS